MNLASPWGSHFSWVQEGSKDLATSAPVLLGSHSSQANFPDMPWRGQLHGFAFCLHLPSAPSPEGLYHPVTSGFCQHNLSRINEGERMQISLSPTSFFLKSIVSDWRTWHLCTAWATEEPLVQSAKTQPWPLDHCGVSYPKGAGDIQTDTACVNDKSSRLLLPVLPTRRMLLPISQRLTTLEHAVKQR